MGKTYRSCQQKSYIRCLFVCKNNGIHESYPELNYYESVNKAVEKVENKLPTVVNKPVSKIPSIPMTPKRVIRLADLKKKNNILKMHKWWNGLTRDEQIKYKKIHPNSKLKIKVFDD